MTAISQKEKSKQHYFKDLVRGMLPGGENLTFRERLRYLSNWKRSYLWLSFALPILIMYLIYLAMQIHPFGNGSVLVLDLNAQYVGFFEALREFVHGNASLLYSFSRQLGGEFMGIYAYYIASPLSYIVALFPREAIQEALLFLLLLKTGLCGLSAGFYLHKITDPEKRQPCNVIIFSVMYALCSYAIVQQSNTMWIDALIWLPLLTYGIENLIKYRKFKLYVISLALTIMSNYYIGYMVCIYTALYFGYYYVAHSQNGANNPLGESKHFVKTLLRAIVYSVLAVGISAVIILTAYYSLTFGKSTFTNPSWKVALKFDLMDYLTQFLPGSYSTVRWRGLPFVYCGTLTLFMLPVYFISGKISTREKIMSGVMISLFSLCFMINVVDLVWHGFQEPNWLNHRYSFMLSFLMIVMAYKGLCDAPNISGKVHLTTTAFIVLFLVVAQKYTFSSFNSEKGAPLSPYQTIAFSLLCLAVYLIMLGVLRKTPKPQSMSMVLVVIVCLEMFANGLQNVVGLNNDVAYASYSSYSDFMKNIRPIVDKVQAMDTSFYRMEKMNIIIPRSNDNMALNIRGLTSSSSTLNRETIQLLYRMGYINGGHKNYYTGGGNPVNDSLLGLRYIIMSDNGVTGYLTETGMDNYRDMLTRNYVLYTTENGYSAYYNPYALSLAYGVNKSTTVDFSFKTKSDKEAYFTPYHKLNAMVSAMLGSETELFKTLGKYSVTTNNCSLGIADRHTSYSPKDGGSSAEVIYTITAPRDGDVYFYLPSLYPREVQLTLNGNDFGTFYGANTDRSMLLGYFRKGETITLKMKLNADVLYVKNDVDSFYYLDDTAFRDAFAKLSATQLVLDDQYSEDHLTGTLRTLTNDQTILTTIPYDEGWIVKVDGKKVDYYKTFDSLITFDIGEEGSHSVEFLYRPKCFVYGMLISGGFTVLFLLLILFEKPIYRFIYAKLYDEGEGEGEGENMADGEEIETGDAGESPATETSNVADPPKEVADNTENCTETEASDSADSSVSASNTKGKN
ncbi:MAG: YfhO family protein [Clostridia bacterium]|nr:YfhO family protein [Clostridia bacterium]